MSSPKCFAHRADALQVALGVVADAQLDRLVAGLEVRLALRDQLARAAGSRARRRPRRPARPRYAPPISL